MFRLPQIHASIVHQNFGETNCFCFCTFVSVYPCLFPHTTYSPITHPLSTCLYFFISFASLCGRILLTQQRERLQASVAGSSVQSVLNLNRQRTFKGRPQQPRSPRRRPTAARLLILWVPIPPGAWTFVCCECSVLSGSLSATN